MSLLDKLPEIDELVKEEVFYQLLESHLDYLRSHPSTMILTTTGQTADKYAGDYYGLLNYLGINKKYHYPIMRVNGFYTSTDYDGTSVDIYQPPLDAINRILSIYNSRMGN